MTSVYSQWSPGSQTPPEPTPLRKQAHYAWVTAPPVQLPVRRIVYIGQHALEHLGQGFIPEEEIISFHTAFRAHYWLEQIPQEEVPTVPEAILCDLSLPDGSAFELFDRIRRMPHMKSIPFFALTASVDRETGQKVLQHGMDDLFAYDFKREDLEARANFLQKHKAELRLPRRSEEVSTEFSPTGFKRMLDVWVALLGLVLLSPFLLLISLLIKLGSKGPVLSKTRCAGTGYQVFHCYSFRTHSLDTGTSDEQGELTRLGKWLTRYNLDELPQLINILQGDMSLVGNRPLPLQEAEQLTTDQWAKRFLAPAGVTGIWQLARRSQADLSEEDRRQMDVEYADHASFRYDIRILFQTMLILLRRSAK